MINILFILGDILVNFSSLLSKTSKWYEHSEIRLLLKIIEQKNIISFGGGLPGSEILPKEDLAKIAYDVILKEGDKSIQYGPTLGSYECRKAIKDFLYEKKGISIDKKEDFIITTGSQQALDLLSRALIDPGDIVIVEAPTYLASLNSFRSHHPKFISVPMDENGMKTDILDEKIKSLDENDKKRIKFIYTIPIANNPTGITMNTERKKHLLEIASKYDLAIIEDDPYSYLVYDENIDVKALKVMDKDKRVIHLTTFSKILAPGLRVGVAIANNVIIEILDRIKQVTDLHTSSLSQFIVSEAIKRKVIDKTIKKAKKVYKEKRDVMLEELERNMPSDTWWPKPIGGLFIMVWLSKEIDTKEMLKEALNRGVAYIPGYNFFADKSGKNTMRLNFSYPKIGDISKGLKILGKLVKEKLS